MAFWLVPALLKIALIAGVALASNTSDLQECLTSSVSDVVFEGDLLYQATAVQRYNLNIPVSPAAVTSPENAKEVAAVVKCASDNGLSVQARSGGHSFGNHGLGGSDGAVVVDLEKLQKFSMDESTWVATIGSGTLLGDVTTRLSDAGGRAMSHGICPQVGSGGHFTIGGLGPTSRLFGTSLDHIVEVEAVLANSSIVRASETQNPDVFFAVKGAASSFAIVTEFKVRTQPEPEQAVQYSYSFTLGDTKRRADLFKKWQAYVSQPDLSRKFASVLTLLGDSIMISGTYLGSKAEYDALGIADKFPGSNNSSTIVFDDWLGLVGHWAEDITLELLGGIPAYFYSKSRAFTQESLMSSSDADHMFEFIDNADKGTPVWFVIFDLAGGAVNDVPVDATAYSHRDVVFWLQSYAVNPLGEISQTTHDFLDRLNELTAAGNVNDGLSYQAYPGYIDPRLPNAQAAYWGSNLQRLERIKEDIDPKNVFRNPQSVHGQP